MMWSQFVRQAQANESLSVARSFDCVYAARTPSTFVDSHLQAWWVVMTRNVRLAGQSEK